MRKINFLKGVFGVALAMLMTVGAFGQVANSDYVEYREAVAPVDTIDYVTLKTGGTTMGYYAEPDPVYHPQYNAGDGWLLTTDFVWNWSVPTYPGATAPTLGGGTPANYVTIEYPTLGDYVVNVAEQSPAAFGGCVDATPTIMNVTVIEPPSAGFATVDDTICGDFLAQTIVMNIEENVPANWASWAFAVVRVTENIDAAGNRIGSASLDSTTLYDYTLAVAGKARRNSTAGFAGTSPNYTFTFTTPALTVQNSQRTRYSYRLYTPAGATGTGIVSAISQKSDYLLGGTINAYAFTDSEVVFTANPAPSTGPIFYIPNDFNY